MTQLDRIIEQINRRHVYIQMHNFPDPDAIASAFGLQELLKYCGIESTICYKGTIERYSTERMRQMLRIKLENIENLSDRLTEDDEVILVDAQKGNSNIINIKGDEIICIDHHPTFEKYEYLMDGSNYTKKNVGAICDAIKKTPNGLKFAICNKVKNLVISGELTDVFVIRELEKRLQIDLIGFLN